MTENSSFVLPSMSLLRYKLGPSALQVMLIIREMQVTHPENTMRDHLAPIGMATIKIKKHNNKFWQVCGESGNLVQCW